MIKSFNQALASLNTSRLQGHSLDIDSLFIVLFYGILLQCVQSVTTVKGFYGLQIFFTLCF